jgi:hypothetical protein
MVLTSFLSASDADANGIDSRKSNLAPQTPFGSGLITSPYETSELIRYIDYSANPRLI